MSFFECHIERTPSQANWPNATSNDELHEILLRYYLYFFHCLRHLSHQLLFIIFTNRFFRVYLSISLGLSHSTFFFHSLLRVFFSPSPYIFRMSKLVIAIENPLDDGIANLSWSHLNHYMWLLYHQCRTILSPVLFHWIPKMDYFWTETLCLYLPAMVLHYVAHFVSYSAFQQYHIGSLS